MLVNGVPNDGYQVTLADLIDIADAACHLEAYMSMLVDNPSEQAIVNGYVRKLHDISTRSSGSAEGLIYASSPAMQLPPGSRFTYCKPDGSQMLDYEAVKEFYFEKGAADHRGHGRLESAFYHTIVMVFEQGMKAGART
jgi:hypothetical protein